jgi:hypothetical protein
MNNIKDNFTIHKEIKMSKLAAIAITCMGLAFFSAEAEAQSNLHIQLGNFGINVPINNHHNGHYNQHHNHRQHHYNQRYSVRLLHPLTGRCIQHRTVYSYHDAVRLSNSYRTICWKIWQHNGHWDSRQFHCYHDAQRFCPGHNCYNSRILQGRIYVNRF